MATSTPTDATLIRLRERLAAADMDDVRRALLMLSEKGRQDHEQRLGAATVARLVQSVRRLRGPSNWRVPALR